LLKERCLPFIDLGATRKEKVVSIMAGKVSLLEEDMPKWRDIWNATSTQLELLQANPDCVNQETKALRTRKGMNFSFSQQAAVPHFTLQDKAPRVAIIREEGSNGDREMAAAFCVVGCSTWDITMSDLLDKKITLDRFSGVVFVGGFSYADVMDSGKGWAAVIRFNKEILAQFTAFYNRKDTFSFGVCNGCQLMALLGWIPTSGSLSGTEQPRFIHNASGRFESRFCAVKILPSPSVLLKGMEGNVLGVWVAHGEGRAYFPKEETLDMVTKEGEENLSPIRYVNDDNEITESYPFNPNGSPRGAGE